MFRPASENDDGAAWATSTCGVPDRRMILKDRGIGCAEVGPGVVDQGEVWGAFSTVR